MIQDLLIVLSAPILRSVTGWLRNALKDKKITRFEWKKLVETIVRVGTLGVLGYYGFSVSGISNPAVAAGVASFLADKLFSALKKV